MDSPLEIVLRAVRRGRFAGESYEATARWVLLALRDAGWHLLSTPVVERRGFPAGPGPDDCAEEIRVAVMLDDEVLEERVALSLVEVRAASAPGIIEDRCALVVREFLFALGARLGLPSGRDPYYEDGP